MSAMKAGLEVALLAWVLVTLLLLFAWATATSSVGWYPHVELWAAVWAYHFFVLVVIGTVAVLGWFVE